MLKECLLVLFCVVYIFARQVFDDMNFYVGIIIIYNDLHTTLRTIYTFSYELYLVINAIG